MALTRLMMMALLVFSCVVILKTLLNTPAFNPRLVSDTITGQGRIGLSRMMYDKGEYDFQRGYGFLKADAILSSEAGDPEKLAPPGVAKYRAYKASDALESAVSLDPGNAHAWAALGWARVRLSDTSGALAALRTSWSIAPNNLALAETRLSLAGLLTYPGLAQEKLSAEDISAITRDRKILADFSSPASDLYRQIHPHLFQEDLSQLSD